LYTCQICQKQFKTVNGLAAHLTNKSSSCYTNVKDYYNKYIRKEGEGICKICGKETHFVSLSKGYPYKTCRICNHKNLDKDKNLKRSKSLKASLKEKSKLISLRRQLIDILRKRTIDRKRKDQCQICGLVFPSSKSLTYHLRVHDITIKDYYDNYFKILGEDICLCYGYSKKCKKKTKFISLEAGYSDYCSPFCTSISPLTLEKKEKTCLYKYGVDHPSKHEEIHKRQIKSIRKTVKERKDEILSKRKETCLDKYNVDSVTKYKPVIDKIRKGLEKYRNSEKFLSDRKKSYDNFLKNVFYPRQQVLLNRYNLKLLDPYNGAHQSYRFQCTKCGAIRTILWNSLTNGFYCKRCNNGKSSGEKVNDFLTSLNIKFIENDRYEISPYELDIFVPSQKIAIEYCGLYWQSELIAKDAKKYHKNKLDLCRKSNIRLIQIFEDEWLYKKEIVKNRIKHILGISEAERIHARKCIIKEITAKEKNDFLEQYHIQGKDTASIKLGAFCNNKLVAVMTFSKGKLSKGSKHKKGTWELSRFAVNYNYKVPGIAGKLLKHFQQNYYWKKIYTYADLRWSEGTLYHKLNFTFKYETGPNYWYLKNGQRIHRFNLRKKPDEPKNIPEWILRQKQGYVRIWDCGHLKFELQNTIS